MTPDAVKSLSDKELALFIALAQAEQKARAEKYKQETIAKIKELARLIEIGVKIEGVRGRQPGAKKAARKD